MPYEDIGIREEMHCAMQALEPWVFFSRAEHIFPHKTFIQLLPGRHQKI
jgi:hypothetical protein